ncbi:hypothetical protein V6Z11_D03G188700 [Gossypium hirsutum]
MGCTHRKLSLSLSFSGSLPLAWIPADDRHGRSRAGHRTRWPKIQKKVWWRNWDDGIVAVGWCEVMAAVAEGQGSIGAAPRCGARVSFLKP